jgi:hypothetical protein
MGTRVVMVHDHFPLARGESGVVTGQEVMEMADGSEKRRVWVRFGGHRRSIWTWGENLQAGEPV